MLPFWLSDFQTFWLSDSDFLTFDFWLLTTTGPILLRELHTLWRSWRDGINTRVGDKLHALKLCQACFPFMGQNNFRPLCARFKSRSQKGMRIAHSCFMVRQLKKVFKEGQWALFLYVRAGRWYHGRICVARSVEMNMWWAQFFVTITIGPSII